MKIAMMMVMMVVIVMTKGRFIGKKGRPPHLPNISGLLTASPATIPVLIWPVRRKMMLLSEQKRDSHKRCESRLFFGNRNNVLSKY